MTAAPPSQDPLYPTRAGAGSLLGRQLYQRYSPPVIVLGLAPGGVEVAAAAAKAMSCTFDVIVGSHIRMEGAGMIGAVAEDGDAVLDPEYSPRFAEIEALNDALEKARRSIKTERLLFRGSRTLRPVQGAHVIVVDGHIVSPWKVLAAAEAARQLGAPHVAIAAPVSTLNVQERVRARRFDFISPTVLMDPAGHKRPFGDPVDATMERLRSIVLARQAA